MDFVSTGWRGDGRVLLFMMSRSAAFDPTFLGFTNVVNGAASFTGLQPDRLHIVIGEDTNRRATFYKGTVEPQRKEPKRLRHR